MKKRTVKNDEKMKKIKRVTLNNVYSNNNTAFSNLIYKLEEETMLNELKQLIKASGRHTNVQKKYIYFIYTSICACACACVCVQNTHSMTEEYGERSNAKNLEQIHSRI